METIAKTWRWMYETANRPLFGCRQLLGRHREMCWALVIAGMGRWDLGGNGCWDAVSNEREGPSATLWGVCSPWDVIGYIWVIVAWIMDGQDRMSSIFWLWAVTRRQ